MKILIAPDKFRGSLNAAQVIEAIAEGIRDVSPDILIDSLELADGGEGTMRILTRQSSGVYRSVEVRDPLGRAVRSEYGYSAATSTAFIEMASASGLNLLQAADRNPLLTSTWGTGELILDAIQQGAKKIILGIGGSATTDGGIGMASALGFRFFDQNGKELPAVGGNMDKIATIDIKNVNTSLHDVQFTVACDVTNPLYGPQGAAYVYGPQKGADQEMVVRLDDGLKTLSAVASEIFGKEISTFPGAGAAGGLGAGAMWFLNAELKEGVGIVMEYSGMDERIADADLVITGEGKIDEQTLQGKVVKGLADVCGKHGVPLIALCGTLSISSKESRDAGITHASSIINRPMSLDDAINNAYALLREATFQIVNLFSSTKKGEI